jgi:hypothetical protein
MKPHFVISRATIFGIFAAILLMVGIVLLVYKSAQASSDLPVAPEPQQPDNSACLGCHGRPDQVYKFQDNSIISISVDKNQFDKSVHANLSCQVCHTNLAGYPHPKNSATNTRDYTMQYKDSCKNCHPIQSTEQNDSVHARSLKAGDKHSAICADCHNPHTTTKIQKDAQGKIIGEDHASIANTCAQCHNTIYEQYASSVHGKGIIREKNPDVPACTDCHGVHKIQDPTQNGFRLSSPEMCGKCHTDWRIMGKYGLSTNVLNTYVADFHGTTVTIFEKTHPDEPTNKAVCYDCHGVHNILSVRDPNKGISIKQNMLVACQRCHPDANLNFPDSWLSHYIPSPTRYPIVFFVNLFYNILIPTVLGGMGVFVAADIYRRVFRRKQASSQAGGLK